jgi:hypothetical protein
MIRQRQSLPLSFEAGDDLPRVHARLDDLKCDFTTEGCELLSHENDPEPTFADLLEQLERTDLHAGTLRHKRAVSKVQPRRTAL